jgi:ABC-type multidrug transport system ATPase subunit
MMLEISHGVVRRGRTTVLEAGELRVEMPAALAVVGINGSGKSSLFMQLTDVLMSRGTASIRVDSRPASLAYVPQEPALPGWLRVERAAGLYGLRFAELLDGMPGLHLDELRGRTCATLSVGQRQVLAVALALGRDADVTLLDEPFAALDFRRRVGTLDLLRERRDSGRAFILSSQSAADLIDVCGHFAVIRDGRYVFDGPIAALARDARDERAVERRLLELLTMPLPAMEVPARRR